LGRAHYLLPAFRAVHFLHHEKAGESNKVGVTEATQLCRLLRLMLWVLYAGCALGNIARLTIHTTQKFRIYCRIGGICEERGGGIRCYV
jgi:hypothetical protein